MDQHKQCRFERGHHGPPHLPRRHPHGLHWVRCVSPWSSARLAPIIVHTQPLYARAHTHRAQSGLLKTAHSGANGMYHPNCSRQPLKCQNWCLEAELLPSTHAPPPRPAQHADGCIISPLVASDYAASTHTHTRSAASITGSGLVKRCARVRARARNVIDRYEKRKEGGAYMQNRLGEKGVDPVPLVETATVTFGRKYRTEAARGRQRTRNVPLNFGAMLLRPGCQKRLVKLFNVVRSGTEMCCFSCIFIF